jgi:sulfur-oxidizing protein SoxZ
MNQARLIFPERIRAGEVITVRLLIQHPMETGYRQDMDGKLIARNVIRLVRCEVEGQEVFRAEPSSGISANPLFEFAVRAVRTARWTIRWEDDAAAQGELSQLMTVE